MTGKVSFGQQLTRLAAQDPDRLALIFAAADGSEIEFSRLQLDRQCNQAARMLADHGVAPGSLVAVALPNCPEHIFTTYGAWKLGATVLPVRWDLPPWERDRLLGLASPSAVVTVDEPLDDGLTLEDVEASTDRDASPVDDHTPDPAHAIASSGSTGDPKLIVLVGRGEVDPRAAPPNPMHLKEDQVVQLVTSPLYHTNGFACHQRLVRGAQLVLMGRFDAAHAVHLIERWSANHVILVPTMLQRIASLPEIDSRDLSSLEQVNYGGAPLSPSVAKRWLDLVGPTHFYFQYGGTERIGVTMARGDEWLTHEGTVGRPFNCDIRILDDNGDECPVGEIGGIFMRQSDGVVRFRYVGSPMPEATEDGFRTFGDLGWVDGDGYLYIADRRQDMIVTGGANVYPAEVELALCEHRRILDSVVIGLPDPEWGRRVHALVELSEGPDPPTADDLRAHCRRMLAAYKVPKSIEIVSRIPRTEAGKVNRSALLKKYHPESVEGQ